jgi:hypothetical protein
MSIVSWFVRAVLVVLALAVLFMVAHFYRYEPIGMTGKVWDRWAHQECDIQSVGKGYGCNYDNARADEERANADQARADITTREQKEKAAQAATDQLLKFVADLPKSGGMERVRILRAAGFTEKEITEWAAELRGKMLAAGSPRNLVDDYFGGDPFIGPSATAR